MFVFFGGGLKRYIQNATLCSAKPPESIMELLRAAKRIELQSEARDKLFELEELSEVEKAEIGYINSKPVNKTIYNDLQLKEIDGEINKLAERINVLRMKKSGQRKTLSTWAPNNYFPQALDRSNCYNCGRPGHFVRDCRSSGYRSCLLYTSPSPRDRG